MDNEQMKKLRAKFPKHLTPVRAIKINCKEFCCVGDLKSWKECSLSYCPLYPYRMGKRAKKEIDIPQHSTKESHSGQEKEL